MDKNIENNTISSSFTDKLKVIFSACAWGTMGVFVRYIGMPSSLIACIRGFIGALFLYAILCIKNKSPRLDLKGIKRNLPWLTVSSIALGFNWVLLFEAYLRTSLSISTLCYYLAPIIVMVASRFLFGEKFTVAKIICIILSVTGMFFVSGILNNNAGSGYGVDGMLCAIGAAFLYATVTLSGKKIKDLSSFDQTIYELFVAAVILVPYNLLTVDAGPVNFSAKSTVLLILLGFIHTGAAFATYFSALHKIEAQIATIFTYLDPVVSILCSVFIFREKTDINCIIGAVLIIGALVVYEILSLVSGKKIA